MKTIQVTLQERWAASKHMVQKSKKTYTRKDKHNKRGPQEGPSYFKLNQHFKLKHYFKWV